jgi:hypothetical protein
VPGDFLLVEVVLLAVLGPEFGTVPGYQGTTDEIEVVGYFQSLPEDFLNCLGIISPEI